MARENQDFVKWKGDLFTVRVLVEDATAFLNLYQAYWKVAESPTSEPILVKTTPGHFSAQGGIAWITNSILVIRVDSEDTKDLTVGVYHHELTIKNPATGESLVVSAGTLDLRQPLFPSEYRDNTKLLLDTVTGALAAFSTTRRIKTGVTDIVKIRRSTGGQDLFTPEEIAAGDDLTYVGAGNDGFYTEILDQSGNNRPLLQATTTNQPKVIAAGSRVTSNGKPAIKCTGTTVGMRTASFAASTGNRSYVMVLEVFNTSGSSFKNYFSHSNPWLDNNTNGFFGRFGTSNQIRNYVGSGGANQSTNGFALLTSTIYIVEAYVTGSSSAKLYVNNTLVHDLAITITPEIANRQLILGEAGNSGHNINVLEAIYWEGDKHADRTTIYNDLSTYYS